MTTIFLYCLLMLSPAMPLQEEVSTPLSEESSPVTEPQTSHKVILYGMTAVGIVLIGMGVRRSKFFKKK